MAEIKNNSDYISNYLEDLKSCLERAKRCEAEKAAEYAAALSKFNRKSDYFEKIKTAWDNIQMTNTKAADVQAALRGLTCVCDKLETYLTCDMDTFAFFVGEVKAFSQQLEHYHCCVERLYQQIDKFNKPEEENKIFAALLELKTRYEAAMVAATAVIPEVMGTLEELCFLHLKMQGEDGGNITECDPLSEDGTAPASDNCGDLQPCESKDLDGIEPDDDCQNLDDTSIEHSDNCEGIKESIEKIQNNWNDHFPLDGFKDDNDESPKCTYYHTTREEYDKAERHKKCANKALEQALQLRNLATSQRTSIEQSYNAAEKANKC